MVFLLQRRTAVEHVEQPRALARWRARETRIPVSDQHAQLVAEIDELFEPALEGSKTLTHKQSHAGAWRCAPAVSLISAC